MIMNHISQTYPVGSTVRRVEGEGVLRILLIALALGIPLATMAYLKVQNTRQSYEMSDIRGRIRVEEERNRKLLLERSRFMRDEEIQSFAIENGMQPRKQAHLVSRRFTMDDQRMAKAGPVSSTRD